MRNKNPAGQAKQKTAQERNSAAAPNKAPHNIDEAEEYFESSASPRLRNRQ
jgi:hypothetical protein